METIVIIGAGASGLACMNELVKTNKYNIIVLEQSNKAARKILASGNGRCNVSNLNMDIKYYNHQDPLIEKLIKEFDVVNFFKQLSLKLRYEKNLVYPYSLSSLSVKNALMKNMDNVSYIDNCEVLAIKKAKTYEIITTNGHYQADKIVIATGSPASHLSGQNNLKMLEKMHISMIPFTPSLVQVKTKPVFKALKGQRVKGIAMLYDQIAVLSLKTEFCDIVLIVVVPFPDQDKYFNTENKNRYLNILKQADEVVTISKDFSNIAYLKRNDYMISNSCQLIAYWDEKSLGGTSYTVRKAREKKLTIYNLFKK